MTGLESYKVVDIVDWSHDLRAQKPTWNTTLFPVIMAWRERSIIISHIFGNPGSIYGMFVFIIYVGEQTSALCSGDLFEEKFHMG